MPPVETSIIAAKRVLVFAPHVDDDVIGCGGLLAQLAAAGASIKVLFLTDSSGGIEVVDDQEKYAERRRAEARRALSCLGIDTTIDTSGENAIEVLPIRDGELDREINQASEGMRAAILNHRPDLILSTSPLEISDDHQAAFRALSYLLSQLRPVDELYSLIEDASILLYEVNHPGYPNILINVSREIPAITKAISEYQSQLELHNYLECALGLRQYRTLSLPASIKAAEGYRALKISDFQTHSLSGLIRFLGGQPPHASTEDGPLISVIVRTKDRPELLREALASIAASTYRNVELVLVNDGGAIPTPPAVPGDFPFLVKLLNLEFNHGRSGAANAGINAATGEYVVFLDDDDLMENEHLATLAGLVSGAGVRIAYTDAAIGVYELGSEGWVEYERRLTYSRNFDPELLLFDNYIPFNTLIIERTLAIEAGSFANDLPFFEDWDFLIRLARLSPFHHHPQVTCEYRQFRGAGHHILGDHPHERADFLDFKAKVIERHKHHHTSHLLAGVIDRLRGETVNAAELNTQLRAETDVLRQKSGECESRYHRINGEVVLLRSANDELNTARQHVQAELEGALNRITELQTQIDTIGGNLQTQYTTVAQQEEHLGRTYAEIERLNNLVKEMESTKVWALHRKIEKIKGR